MYSCRECVLMSAACVDDLLLLGRNPFESIYGTHHSVKNGMIIKQTEHVYRGFWLRLYPVLPVPAVLAALGSLRGASTREPCWIFSVEHNVCQVWAACSRQPCWIFSVEHNVCQVWAACSREPCWIISVEHNVCQIWAACSREPCWIISVEHNVCQVWAACSREPCWIISVEHNVCQVWAACSAGLARRHVLPGLPTRCGPLLSRQCHAVSRFGEDKAGTGRGHLVHRASPPDLHIPSTLQAGVMLCNAFAGSCPHQ